ncbi:uncharacterized protein [Elaeis guineensis]|uniref:uncharacterized protein isoform X1 n=1 Tax=Elaeis guineensis var. tenera TaxID=51953 RepID=UPI003C6CFF8B
MGEIILGMPGPWAEDCREKADHYTTKIGGLPDWPTPDLGMKDDLLHCSVCGRNLCLVAQVYAPISFPKLNLEERVIYILGCPMPKCGGDPRSWRALRVQKYHSEMQLDNNGQVAKPLEEDSAPISKTNNYVEEDSSITGSGREEDESDSDMDLQEFARALSEAASLASQSKKQSTSKHSGSTVRAMATKPRVNSPSIPVVPCFYMYSQKEQSTADKDTICASYSSLSIKEKQNTATDTEDEEKWEGETYEYDTALGADRTYLKFKKQLDAHPEQCFRYSYGGSPLLATTDLAECDTCKFCGSPRNYELQLMPPLLYFLHEAAEGSSAYSPDGWSWMTLIVYTCSKSCCPAFCGEKPGSCCWGVAEEAIIIQNE